MKRLAAPVPPPAALVALCAERSTPAARVDGVQRIGAGDEFAVRLVTASGVVFLTVNARGEQVRRTSWGLAHAPRDVSGWPAEPAKDAPHRAA